MRSDDTLQHPDVFSDNTEGLQTKNLERNNVCGNDTAGCRTRIEIQLRDSRLLNETGRASYDSATRIQLETTLDLTRIDRQENSEGAPDLN